MHKRVRAHQRGNLLMFGSSVAVAVPISINLPFFVDLISITNIFLYLHRIPFSCHLFLFLFSFWLRLLVPYYKLKFDKTLRCGTDKRIKKMIMYKNVLVTLYLWAHICVPVYCRYHTYYRWARYLTTNISLLYLSNSFNLSQPCIVFVLCVVRASYVYCMCA